MVEVMKTDNELIAEFMGSKPYNDGRYGILWPNPIDDNKVGFGLHYNEDWGWLMSVIEKIDSINGCDFEMYPAYNGTINARSGVGVKINLSDGKDIVIVPNGRNRIEVCHKAVVEFIKWYNAQNP